MGLPVSNLADASLAARALWSQPLAGVLRQPFAQPLQAPAQRGLAEPSYHPQLQALAPTGGGGVRDPYGIPAGSTLADVAGGKQAQPFDVTLSKLATAVYGTRGDPPAGWSAVSDQQLRDLGVADPTAWRQQFLGGGEQTKAQEFKAEVYTDGNGNYVLSYRGTAEGWDDWQNNFKQGTGFQTDPVDKFSGTAVNTAREFQRVFGNPPGGAATNLAITGHSQGGGLATVGSLATGIPAVTFDASGIHPNTLDRMGLDPQAARDTAEGGQIRAYSLSSDLLTQTQEGGPLGLLAPDAMGTKIVVDPARADEHHMIDHYGAIELEGKSPEELAKLNALVEAARNTPWIPSDPLIGTLTGVAHLGGGTVYSAMSHSPNALTAAMIDRQPWQPGYENPSDTGKALQDLVPDVLKDDFARNTHDTVQDVVDVVNGDFARGDYVQGGFKIAGDVGEGFWNSVGDTANRGADALAQKVDDGVDGWAGDVLSGIVRGGGDVLQGASDVVGQGVETLADGAGYVAQKGSDFVGWLFGR